MKKVALTSIAVVLAVTTLMAQSPQNFNYQGVARDNTGSILATQTIALQISILEGSATGPSVYIETHNVTTNQFGLFTLQIGNGTVVSGDFTTISWGANTHYAKVEMDATGGTDYQLMGTSQLLSVPYALHAKTAETITETDPVFASSVAGGITGADTTNWNNHTVDTDTQLDSTGVAALGYAAGAHTIEVDADSTNELQALSFSNDTLFLSDGNYVVMPYDSAIWTKTGDTIYYNSGNVGIGTSSPEAKLVIVGPQHNQLIVKDNDAKMSFGAEDDGPGKGIIGINMATASDSISWLIGRHYPGTSGIIDGLSFSRGYGLPAPLWSHKMVINSNGNVGIGTTTPGGQFELSLDQGRKPSTNTWTIVSDTRLKNIEGAYTKGLTEILQLQPITYHYKNAGERSFKEEVLNTLNVGFSAQEVQKIFPEAVGTDDDGYLNFNMHAILVAFVNAIKELKTENEQLKAENEAMKLEIGEIKSIIGIKAKK